MLTIGEAVWLARDLRGVTQATLARELSCSRPQLANIETAHSQPSVHVVEEIARALGVRFATDGNGWAAALNGAVQLPEKAPSSPEPT